MVMTELHRLCRVCSQLLSGAVPPQPPAGHIAQNIVSKTFQVPSGFQNCRFGNVMGEEVGRDEDLAVVNLEHAKRISETFRPNKVKKKSSIPKNVVQEIWRNRLAPRFYSTLMNVMFPEDSREVSFLSFYTIYKNLAEPEAEIMFRALTIYHIATIHEPPFNYEQADEYPNAPLKKIKDYVCDVITSYIHAIIHINMKEALGWLELRASNSIVDGNLVAAYLLKDLEAHRNEVSIGSLEIWLEKNEIYYTVSEQLYLYLFGVNKSIDVKSLIPFPIVQTEKNSKTLLSLPNVLLLNSKLPKRAPRWTLAFLLDSRTSGDWDTFKQIIYGRGQTLIVIQDSNGDIFGMYGSQQWFPSSGFYGNDQSFLFTIKPEVNVYESSSRNNNYQIFTQSGFGMGGTEEHFGLFINSDARTGLTSLSCSTFRQFWPLARELEFKIEQIELWIVNEDPATAADEVIIEANEEKVEQLDLISDNLDLSQLKKEFSNPEPIGANISKKMTEQGGSRKTKDPSSTIKSPSAPKLLRIDKGVIKDESITKTIAQQTKTEASSVVQESMQRSSEFNKGEDKQQIRRCVQGKNDVQSSLVAEMRNVKAPQGKQQNRVSANESFVHPSLKPKQEPAPETPTTTERIKGRFVHKKTAKKHMTNTDDNVKRKYPNKRIGKSLKDVQLQVGNTMILSPKCRLSAKKCACVVKNPCRCATVKPVVQNMLSEEKSSMITVSLESQKNVPINDPSSSKLSKLTVSNISTKPSKLRIIQPPITESASVDEVASITKMLPTVTSEVKVDTNATSSTGSKKDQESCSALGCRCSSSTVTSSDWEEGGAADTVDKLKLKSECNCELNESVWGDLDEASKTKTETVGKTKEMSSSVCSCVLGPKDKGIRSSSQEKQQMSEVPSCLPLPKKETQDLTRSCRKSFTSLNSGESVKFSLTSEVKNRLIRCSGDETVSQTRSERKSATNTSGHTTDGYFRFSEMESQHLVPSSNKTNASVKCRTTAPFRNQGCGLRTTASSLEEQSLSIDIASSALSSDTSPTRSYQKNSIALESRQSMLLSNSTSLHLLGIKDKPQIFEENQSASTEIRKEYRPSNKSTKRSDRLIKYTANSTFSMSIPPTCLTCRSPVKTSGCKCKIRASGKLTPIVEQASELLQQHRHSGRSSILKPDRSAHPKNASKGCTSGVIINIQDSINEGDSECSCDATADRSRLSRSCQCSGNEDDTGKCFCKSRTLNGFDRIQMGTRDNSTIGRSSDLPSENTKRVKKACQCSLPRQCFPQFPEDDIQAEDNLKTCGCGSHAGGYICFPKFLEPAENIADNSSGKEVVSETIQDTEGTSREKKAKNGCPCSEEDGTIIILNVAKCNTMEALQKIVQELDVKYHPIVPQRIPLSSVSDSESKSCNRREVLNSDAVKRILDSKMMRPPKEPSELKDMPPPE